MKYIFLDHDGVMVTANQYGWRERHPNKFEWDKFDEKCVKVLNRIIEATGAEIIASTDWRFESPIEKMQEFYEWMGVIKTPISYTPTSPHYTADNLAGRAFEIKEWLEKNLQEGDTWVVIDDIDMTEALSILCEEGHFIHCRKMYEGIKQCGLEDKIIKILNNENN